jgi:hypothetical protein
VTIATVPCDFVASNSYLLSLNGRKPLSSSIV